MPFALTTRRRFATCSTNIPRSKPGSMTPVGDFDSPADTRVRSRAMLDVLLDAGADINARGRV
jgi:hypothetical protein